MHQERRIARVVVAAATLLALAACGADQAPAKTDSNIYGLATRDGVCAKPQLAQRLNVSSTKALQIVPLLWVGRPLTQMGSDNPDNRGMVFAPFKGANTHVVIDDRLVMVDDIRQLIPCASEDRMQCTTGAGNAAVDDGTWAEVKPNERFEVHVPWRFGNHSETWVTLNGRAANIDAPIAHCER